MSLISYGRTVSAGLLLWMLLIGGAYAQDTAPETGFVAGYLPAEDPTNDAVREAMEEEEFLETSAEFLNLLFVMPRPVALVMAETGTPNAFYSADDHAVIIGYELVVHFIESFGDDETSAEMASGALLFVMFHEIGHCLISELDLPTVGREEDAVDEFATLLLISFGETGETAILGAASWFAQDEGTEDTTPFWDEHSLDMQRFYGIFALLYGTNPARYADMAAELGLPEERLARAERDYQRKDAAWTRLLEPHVRSE